MNGSKELPFDENHDICDVCESPLEDLSMAYTTEYDGMVLTFCSETCFKRYLEDPELFSDFEGDSILE
ncbi:hypothetical protein HQ487_05380 [Candidatus Uhrbacteria bacterium]|nr:hypothetical protein [Candidatus Uhrbacteria bacterium]